MQLIVKQWKTVVDMRKTKTKRTILNEVRREWALEQIYRNEIDTFFFWQKSVDQNIEPFEFHHTFFVHLDDFSLIDGNLLMASIIIIHS